MKILAYDEVDPLGVLELNLLALGFALTPEYAAHIRRTDPRPLPFFGVYAVEGKQVIGQVGVFRLPMVSSQGRVDVGGVWAVSTHPKYAGRGVASILLDEAHSRMRAAGLRFSSLGTDRYRTAYRLYQRCGYEDTQVLASALAPWEVAHQPTRLRAQLAGPEGYDLVDQVFAEVASEYLGFAWRHMPFIRLRDKVALEDIWILWMNNERIGYALAHRDRSILKISSLLTRDGIDLAEAVAAVAAEIQTAYVRVKLNRPIDIYSLIQSGYQVARPDWGAFMIKALAPEATPGATPGATLPGASIEDARQLFGIGTDQFLISWLDIT
jgi:GNAT superfamily N-acetyltransferase